MRMFAFVALAVFAISAQAARHGHDFGDAYHDAGVAPLVVEARIVGVDRVEVTRTIFAVKPLPADTTELRVEGLSKLDMQLPGRADPPELLVADEVVLFLHASGYAWKPCLLNYSLDTLSACGVYFVRGDRVWCFVQGFSPGPASLEKWPPRAGVQGTLDDLRAEIASGLAARRALEDDIATEDPEERAKRLIRWLGAATSPDKGHCPDIRARLAQHALLDVGAPAVPALVEVLASTDDVDRDERVLGVLGGMKAAAKDAVPRLVELAAAPGKIPLVYLASTLADIADARAIPPLRRLLADTKPDDRWMMDEVCRGLRACKDPDAEKLIAEKLAAK